MSVAAKLSQKEPTRIKVEGTAIGEVFGNVWQDKTNPAGEVIVETDPAKGELYVRPVSASATKPINLFVSTTHATYTLLLQPVDMPADTIVLRDRTHARAACDGEPGQGAQSRADADAIPHRDGQRCAVAGHARGGRRARRPPVAGHALHLAAALRSARGLSASAISSPIWARQRSRWNPAGSRRMACSVLPSRTPHWNRRPAPTCSCCGPRRHDGRHRTRAPPARRRVFPRKPGSGCCWVGCWAAPLRCSTRCSR